MTPLSAEATAICAAHYKTHGKGNGCNTCPIAGVCIISFVLTENNLAGWLDRVNAAATAWKGQE